MNSRYFKIFNPFVISYRLGLILRNLKYRINPHIQIGQNVRIESGAFMSTEGGGKIVIGNNCKIHHKAFLLTWGGDIILGDDCSVNAFTTIYGQGGIKIGNNVMIASNVTLIPAMHQFGRLDMPMNKQPQEKKGIVIDDDVWIGTGVRVLDGVHIAEGCVIGAGAVLNKSTEPYGVYVGIPAKKIKSRR